ncbi:MAG: hypothetical protein VZT48_08220 [Bulleidia sp.]|nr:hypothetical protein [Bulleidia sp.]
MIRKISDNSYTTIIFTAFILFTQFMLLKDASALQPDLSIALLAISVLLTVDVIFNGRVMQQMISSPLFTLAITCVILMLYRHVISTGSLNTVRSLLMTAGCLFFQTAWIAGRRHFESR